MSSYLSALPHPGFFYFVSRETVHNNTLHARMIFYNGEDPATGSAGGCCTAWAVKHGVLASEQPGTIEQGLEMKRPSFLHIRATKTGDLVSNVRVGGNVVHVIDGTVTL
jgi:trans-2,3-dihydro-3-hydroxyanthranilate isomerase